MKINIMLCLSGLTLVSHTTVIFPGCALRLEIAGSHRLPAKHRQWARTDANAYFKPVLSMCVPRPGKLDVLISCYLFGSRQKSETVKTMNKKGLKPP